MEVIPKLAPARLNVRDLVSMGFNFETMAKRFTDTEKWEDEWFTDLSNDYKVIWFYLLDTCDNAGVWKKNIKKLNYLCNTNVSTDDLIKVFGKRIQILKDDKWFIKKFCIVQYGHDFLQSKNKAVISAVKKLNIEGVLVENTYSIDTLSIDNEYPIDTPKEQEQDKEQVKDNNQEQVKDKDRSKLLAVYTADEKPTIQNTIPDNFNDLPSEYMSTEMIENVFDRFVAVDNKFKLNSVILQINEEFGGFENLLNLKFTSNDITDESAKQNYRNRLQEYKRGIFVNN